MINVTPSTIQTVARCRPLLALLLPLSLLPLASCAQDTLLAQNYQTANPGYEQPTYSTQPPAYAGNTPNAGQFLAPPQLADLVARIALYPDDLIGIILPASTYPLQIVQAARYLDAVRSNSTLAPDDSWDNSVVALLNYPDVVNMMDRELEWTERLGQAVIMQQPDVIAAIGQFRAQAQAAGNLRSDERQVVEINEGAIRIRPANPQIIYVPQYEPTRVIVYQSEPVFRYYPRPCPVYYYNYESGYPSGFTNFWGVSTMFTIGWSSRRVHMHDYDYYDDPRFDRPYNGYFYRRGRHDWHDDDDGDRWHGDDRHDDHDGYGPRRPPRERDWQPGRGHGPRPMGVGNSGGERDNDGRGHGAGAGNGGEQGRPFVGPAVSRGNVPAARPDRPGPRPGAGTPTRGGFPGNNGGRDDPRVSDPPQDTRFTRPMPARENDRGRGDPPQRGNFSQPIAPRVNAGGRGDPPQDRGFSRPMAPRENPVRRERAPDNRFSQPIPSRDVEIRSRPVAPPTLVGPSRSLSRDENVRNNVRPVMPSRQEGRDFAPSRDTRISAPPVRQVPSRVEPRSAVGARANPRGDDGPTPSRRGHDDDRGRGNRDR